MVTCHQNGPRLFIRYRFRPFAVLGALGLVAGLGLLVLAMLRWHTATLACDANKTCTLTRVAVVGSERITVSGLRGAAADATLVLRADPDVEMGPHAEGGQVASYRRAAERIERWLVAPSQPLAVSVENPGATRTLGIGGVLAMCGLALLAVFAIGSRVRVDAGGEFWRHGSRLVRGKSDDITAVSVRGSFVMATLRDGRELPLLATLGGRKRNPPGPRSDLEEVAAKIREHLRL